MQWEFKNEHVTHILIRFVSVINKNHKQMKYTKIQRKHLKICLRYRSIYFGMQNRC
jgi:hypothetical protein